MTGHDLHPQISAGEAFNRLVAGNERFLNGTARFPTVQKDVLTALAREQHPYATIVGCSDSRFRRNCFSTPTSGSCS